MRESSQIVSSEVGETVEKVGLGDGTWKGIGKEGQEASPF